MFNTKDKSKNKNKNGTSYLIQKIKVKLTIKITCFGSNSSHLQIATLRKHSCKINCVVKSFTSAGKSLINTSIAHIRLVDRAEKAFGNSPQIKRWKN